MAERYGQGVLLKPWERLTRVTFVDDAGGEYRVELPRSGHSDSEVRAVAYRWACKQVAEGRHHPHGELRFRSLGVAD